MTKENFPLPEEVEFVCPSCGQRIGGCDSKEHWSYEFDKGESVICAGNGEHICEDCYNDLPDEPEEEE